MITVGPGSSVVDTATVSFATPEFSGSVEEWAVSDTTNPFSPGRLDVIYQVTDLSGSIQTFGISAYLFDDFVALMKEGAR